MLQTYCTTETKWTAAFQQIIIELYPKLVQKNHGHCLFLSNSSLVTHIDTIQKLPDIFLLNVTFLQQNKTTTTISKERHAGPSATYKSQPIGTTDQMSTLMTSSTNVNMATMSPRGSHANKNPENDIEFVLKHKHSCISPG